MSERCKPITQDEREELAHEMLWENLVNSGRTALLNLNAVHVCYMTLRYAIDLSLDAAPDEEEAKRMIEDVLEDILEDRESDNAKPKIKIRHDLFIPWIHDDYDQNDIVEAWGGGEDIEDHAIGIAGLIPIQHIQNWEEIKHYYDKEEFESTEFNTLSEYYEDDGYVEFIPDELEVYWVYGESDDE